MQAVRRRRDLPRAARHTDAVVGLHAVRGAGQSRTRLRQHHVVLAHNGATLRARHRKRARSVQRQVAGREERAVQVVVVFRLRGTRGGERVGRALGRRHEHLVRALHVDRARARARHARAGQHDLHLRVLVSVHHDAPVRERAGEHVGPLGRDRDRVAADAHARARDGARAVRQRDLRRRRRVVAAVQVALREHVRRVERARRRRGRRLRRRARARVARRDRRLRAPRHRQRHGQRQAACHDRARHRREAPRPPVPSHHVPAFRRAFHPTFLHTCVLAKSHR